MLFNHFMLLVSMTLDYRNKASELLSPELNTNQHMPYSLQNGPFLFVHAIYVWRNIIANIYTAIYV